MNPLAPVMKTLITLIYVPHLQLDEPHAATDLLGFETSYRSTCAFFSRSFWKSIFEIT
jgi:hypothetical protein